MVPIGKLLCNLLEKDLRKLKEDSFSKSYSFTSIR